MRKSACMWLGLGLALASAGTAAQTVTGSGTSGTVPVFTGTSTVGNSPIAVSGGNVGIGTTNPLSKLAVFFSDPETVGWNANNIGIAMQNTANLTNAWDGISFNGANGVVVAGIGAQITNQSSYYGDIAFYNRSSAGWSEKMRIVSTGNVGIGTTAPAYNLDVTGSIRATTGYVFPDGTTQSTAFIPANCGADYAESVGVTGDRAKYEPGDILVIDPDAPGKFLKSNQAYSTLVSGIYSTKPGFVGRLEPAGSEASKTEVPMAMVGRVPTKVSAENGPIKVGDLLVTSSTLGYAMKGTDPSRMLGAVVGKALGSLDSGTGVIEVLVTLQ